MKKKILPLPLLTESVGNICAVKWNIHTQMHPFLKITQDDQKSSQIRN